MKHRYIKWMAGALVVTIGAAGWLGWQAHQWREDYYTHTVAHLIWKLESAQRILMRARNTDEYEQKKADMVNAYGYLVSAHVTAGPLLDRLAPSKKGRPVYEPTMAVPLLVQYARDLTPDLPDHALERRIELVGGLIGALEGGETDRMHDCDRYSPGRRGSHRPGLGSKLSDIPFQPLSCQVVGPWGTVANVTSDAGGYTNTDLLGVTVHPYTVEELTDGMRHLLESDLPQGWASGTYTIIQVPLGLPQTLTLHMIGDTPTDLALWNAWKAPRIETVTVQEP